MKYGHLKLHYMAALQVPQRDILDIFFGNTEDKQKIASLEAEVSRLKSVASSSSLAETSASTDVTAMKDRLAALEQENAKLTDDLTAKIGEFEEVKFRLSAMAPSFEKAQARVAQLNAEKNDLLARIASLEGQIAAVLSGNQPRPSVSLSASSVMSTGSLPDSNASGGSGAVSASTPKRLSFDSPVRFQNPPTVTTSADTISGSSTHTGVAQSASTSSAPPVSLASQVPKLFKSSVEPAFSSTQASSTPIVEDSSSENRSDSASQESTPAIQVVPSSPVTYSLATSSAARISPGQSLFGKSAPAAVPSVSTSTANSSSEGNNVCGSVVTEAEQSSQVSGSGEVRRDVNDDDGAGHNDSAGESRDSGSGMPVSSSDGRRKRSATNESSSCESKRHRDSPSEVVTSSEERRDLGKELSTTRMIADSAAAD
ncbi:hypothetical protein COOONC_06355 [Cooperia oncophora]